MSELKAGTILNYIKLFISLGIGFFISPFILTSLGKSEYGIYTIAGTIIGWLALCDFGLTSSTTKFLSEYQAKGDLEGSARYLGNVTALFSVIGGGVLILGLLIYPFLGYLFPNFNGEEIRIYRILYLMTLLNTALMFPFRGISGIAASRQKYKIPGLVGVFISLATTLAMVCSLLLGFKSITLCAVNIVFGVLNMVWNAYYCFRCLRTRICWQGWDIPLCKSMFTVSVWLFLQQLVSSFNYNCGSVIVGAVSGASEISIYSYGHALASYFFMLSSCMAGLYLPRIVSIVQNSECSIAILTELMVKVGRYHVIILLLPLIGIIFLGKEFFINWIGHAIGNDANVSWYVAVMMSLTLFPVLVQSLAWQIMIAKDLLKYQVRVTIFTSFVIFLVGMLLTSLYGAIGMAVSFTCSTVIAFVSLWGIYSKRIGLPMLRIYANIYRGLFIPCIIIVACVVAMQCYLLPCSGWLAFSLKAFILTLLYIIVMFFLYFNRHEKTLLLSLFQKKQKLQNR